MKSDNLPKRIGLTGGIGSGKTYVAKIFERKGFPVFYSDRVAISLMTQNKELIQEVKSLLGEESYVNGALNRHFIAELIFKDNKLLDKMNALIHPAVRQEFELFIKQNQDKQYVFNEAAILFETGSYKSMDYNILVIAPEAVRIDRVMKRDGTTRDKIEERMTKQWSDDKKIPLANFLIYNVKSSDLEAQIDEIITQLK